MISRTVLDSECWFAVVEEVNSLVWQLPTTVLFGTLIVVLSPWSFNNDYNNAAKHIELRQDHTHLDQTPVKPLTGKKNVKYRRFARVFVDIEKHPSIFRGSDATSHQTDRGS